MFLESLLGVAVSRWAGFSAVFPVTAGEWQHRQLRPFFHQPDCNTSTESKISLPYRRLLPFVDNNGAQPEVSVSVYYQQFFAVFPLAKLAYLALKLAAGFALQLRSLAGLELVLKSNRWVTAFHWIIS